MSEPLLVINKLKAEVEGKPILTGVNLVLPPGEVHALMGPNGSGKSTLANVLMGHPAYVVTGGQILFKGQDVTARPADERARLGMFLALQYPVEVGGVSVLNFLRTALGATRGADVPLREFRSLVEQRLGQLGMDMSFARRNLNEGFSGGEKKRNEVLQMSLLEPDLAILDETDSGLDVDGIMLVAEAVNRLREQRPQTSGLVITHYMRILNHLKPHRVHVMFGGQVVQSGGPELAVELETSGYDAIRGRFEPAITAEPRGSAELQGAGHDA